MSTITIGVDLAKSVFSVCELDGFGHVLRRQDLRREPFSLWLTQLPAGTVVAMEACSGAALLGTALLEVWPAATNHRRPVRHPVSQRTANEKRPR